MCASHDEKLEGIPKPRCSFIVFDTTHTCTVLYIQNERKQEESLFNAKPRHQHHHDRDSLLRSVPKPIPNPCVAAASDVGCTAIKLPLLLLVTITLLPPP